MTASEIARALGTIAAVAAFVSAPLLLPYASYLTRIAQ
jgi:hypothetical protein